MQEDNRGTDKERMDWTLDCRKYELTVFSIAKGGELFLILERHLRQLATFGARGRSGHIMTTKYLCSFYLRNITTDKVYQVEDEHSSIFFSTAMIQIW